MSADQHLSHIKLLLLDVDGVLTDGRITYTDSGDQVKQFNVKDGLGLRLLMDAGVDVGVITARTSNALRYRCSNLGISLIFDGTTDKVKALETISKDTGIEFSHMAYAGDDLIDLPVMTRVGVSFSVADAVPEVKSHADIVTEKNGGEGAVREICERILKAKQLWHRMLETYLQ